MKIFLLALALLIEAFCPGTSSLQSHIPLPAYEPSNLTLPGLFDTDDILDIKLTGNLRELFSDRGEKVKYHPIVVSYATADSGEVAISAEAKTRGHFRKAAGNCLYPPLMLHFMKNAAFTASVFFDQVKLKLVMPCQGDEYVVREWMVYRLYNLITPKSFKARLVRVQPDDTKKKKTAMPFYGILLEEEQQMAKRNRSVLIDKQMMKPEQIDETKFLTMAVFEYLIGNTDWSVQYQQNVKLLLQDSTAFPTCVPYDFDHAGVVNAPYAKPAEELQMYSVTARRYRGYCVPDMKKFSDVIAVFKHLKKDIYNLYTSCPLLDAGYLKATKKYFDEFYSTINNSNAMQKEFSYPCDVNGTGNVVIKGLRKNK
jgi:hypothetical protein